jgi:7-carboxy-7-deazaguanine synthase (Cx14CxxC type)
MSYAVKEVFFSLQGEGANSGCPAVFCRFAGCNLWSGREEDRREAICKFCDTDFRGIDGEGGGRFESAELLADHICAFWPSQELPPFVIFTGGEPSLQLDDPLVALLHERGGRIAVETNGTLPLPAGLDWVCVSPKAGTKLCVCEGQELKLVYPQVGVDPAAYLPFDFEHFFLQPRDGPDFKQTVEACLRYCLTNPRWRLSLQTHKFLGIR